MTAEITDENRVVPQAASLQGKFAPSAKERIAAFLANVHVFEPTLGLLYGDTEGVVAGCPSWSLIAYPPEIVSEMMDMYASFGAVVAYEMDDFRVVVPQMSHIALLDSGTFDFVGDRLIALTPAAN